MFWGKSNKDTAKQQAEQFGPQWRAQVSITSKGGDASDAKERWKPLEDWEAVYEPPQPPQSQSAATSYMAQKAKQVLVQKVQTRVSSKIMTIGQETVSKILTKGEEEATTAGLKKSLAKNSKAWDALGSLLNNLNGIVLTFRFERDNATQCLYLRRVATDNVADTLQQVFEAAKEEGAHIENLRTSVTSAIESQKDKVKTFVETSLDEALQEAVAKAEDEATDKLAAAKKQLKNAAGNATSALDKVTSNVESVNHDPATREEIQELESNIQKQRVDIKDESVAMLSDCIKLLVLKKMDKLTILMVYVVDMLFDSVEELYKTATEFKLGQQQLRDHVYDIVQTAHDDYQKKVTLEVKRAVTVLEAIMADNGGDDDGTS
jgi:hypothetical protein